MANFLSYRFLLELVESKVKDGYNFVEVGGSKFSCLRKPVAAMVVHLTLAYFCRMEACY